MACYKTGLKLLITAIAVLLATLIFGVSTEAGPLTCNGCHGVDGSNDYRPLDEPSRNPATGAFQGNHRTHMGTTRDPQACVKCHPGSNSYTASHREGMIKLSPNINNSPHPEKAIYKNSTSAFLQASNPNLEFATCSNVNCHFEQKTPAWGSATLTPDTGCNVCHGAPPADGSHGGKHGQAYGNNPASCTKCHVNHLAEAYPFFHSTSVGKRPLAVQFVAQPNKGGIYSGYSGNLTDILPSQRASRNGYCSNLYCHSDGQGNAPNRVPVWSGPATSCDSCHRYQGAGFLNMTSNAHGKLVSSSWIRKYPCTFCHAATVTPVTHVQGKPPVDGEIINGSMINGLFSSSRHVNGVRDIEMGQYWKIDGDRKSYPLPSYNPETKVCDNVYCHSDGTSDPETIRAFPWNWRKADGQIRHAECNDCHGHPRGDDCTVCHDGRKKFVIANVSTVLSVTSGWPAGEEWKSALPMFPNEGANKPRANSHPRHMQTDFTCDECHFDTISIGGNCKLCHDGSIGKMGEASHLNPDFHVNKQRDVKFKQGGTYNQASKSCSNTKCHTGDDPVWGASTNNAIICLTCHGTWTGADTDEYGKINGFKAQINLREWEDTGHGRPASKGNYKSGNPAAKFPGNPCWYCHDNKVMHNYSSNPFRLKIHTQFINRFEHECVFCHMQRTDAECLSCHNTSESLAPQLANITSSHTATAKWPDGTPVVRPAHNGLTSCMTIDCHYVNPATPAKDMKIHNNGSDVWTLQQKEDVKNQYVMMGVCLQCHDDDSNGKCNGCHDGTKEKYQLGYNPGAGFIKPSSARASSVHFGHKHYQGFIATGGWDPVSGKARGTWKGGKFCWDCHDPHGDTNVYMTHDKVATTTEGRFGIPKTQAAVVFTQKVTGSDYAKSTGTINGICNVCHSVGSNHFRSDGGDDHNISYVCTKCHEHRFTDSHADNKSCNSCHKNKPVPRHSGFGLPVDCIKCHTGNVGARVDVIGQFKGQSHHVQGVPISNKHCYQCHWESTPEGLIDNQFHEGYNFKNYSTKKNFKVDLVVYGPGVRPTAYRTYSTLAGRTTAVQFLASNIAIGSTNMQAERKESAKINNHCISCHSDQNNDIKPFDDCKTPRQYAWDRTSIAARYAQKGVTKWGKYSSTTVAAKYKTVKSLSAHGNAAANQGGWNSSTGHDTNFTDTRIGFASYSAERKNVQCFDCHNSHGSKAGGVTSSYVSYSGLKNGANLKEVTAGKGGYKVNYYAKGKAAGVGVVNPYNPGAAQCFDCHMNSTMAAQGTSGPPWGYQSTYNATQPIKSYRDGYKFADRSNDPYKLVNSMKNDKNSKQIMGGHLKATTPLKKSVEQPINGLCTPCHDPHGVSPTLGSKQAYAVPLLKDTWMTSPYKEDYPAPDPTGPNINTYAGSASWGTAGYRARKYPGTDSGYNTGWNMTNEPVANYKLDRNTLGTSTRISQDDSQFAGLCLRCHTKKSLLGNYTSSMSPNSASWKSVERIHAATKGWGSNKEHSFTCSKCHHPHNSALPRLMQTNCLDYQHRGFKASGGQPMAALKAMALVGGTGWRSDGCSSSPYELRGYPIASLYGGGNYAYRGTGYNTALVNKTVDAAAACHVSRPDGPNYNADVKLFKPTRPTADFGEKTAVPGIWPDGNYWNSVTPWPLSK